MIAARLAVIEYSLHMEPRRGRRANPSDHRETAIPHWPAPMSARSLQPIRRQLGIVHLDAPLVAQSTKLLARNHKTVVRIGCYLVSYEPLTGQWESSAALVPPKRCAWAVRPLRHHPWVSPTPAPSKPNASANCQRLCEPGAAERPGKRISVPNRKNKEKRARYGHRTTFATDQKGTYGHRDGPRAAFGWLIGIIQLDQWSRSLA
jgi:hypothetical protein